MTKKLNRQHAASRSILVLQMIFISLCAALATAAGASLRTIISHDLWLQLSPLRPKMKYLFMSGYTSQ